MNAFALARLYLDTLRFLKPVQVYGRLRFTLTRPEPDTKPPPPVRESTGRWAEPVRKGQSQFGPDRVRFLQLERQLDRCGWEDPTVSKLWLYHLHYFDDLNAAGAEERSNWHEGLIQRWIA